MKIRLQTHYRRNLELSIPIIFSQLSTVLIMTSDAIMVGNHSSIELAAAAFGNNMFFLNAIPGFGLASALKPLIANAHAGGHYKTCRAFLRHGLLLIFSYTLLLLILWPAFRATLPLFGQPDAVVRLAEPFLRLTIFSLVPFLLFVGITQFMEALSEARLPMYLNLVGAVFNIGLNYLLIFGHWGFPELGLLGAGWATLLTRCFLLLIGVWLLVGRRQFRAFLPESWRTWELERFRRLLELGVPIGFQRLFEFTSFMMAALMVGWLGAIPLAAHQIGLSLSMITFMIAVGLSEGNTIHVANQVGREAFDQIRPAGQSAFILIAGFMGMASVLFVLFREQIPLFFISLDDPNLESVRTIAATLIGWAAIYQVADGVQAVAMGALRGLEDVRIPTLIALLAYWGIGVPVGYIAGFVLEGGATGIWLGLVVGLSTAALLLVLRFRWLSRRYRAQK